MAPENVANQNNCRHGDIGDLIRAPSRDFPPVRILEISANAALTSLQVASKCMATLEHLTWVVPDLSRQAGSMRMDWNGDTSALLANLRRNAKRLHTLRICIEGTTYEGHHSYGNLMGSFREHVPHLSSLRKFELHITSKSPWMGLEFMEALPSTVERIYVSDTLTYPDALLDFVTWRYKSHLVDGPESRLGSRKTPPSGPVDEEEQHHTIVGEGLSRKDFIRMNTGRLGFLGYEYDGSLSTKQKFRLLKLNGLLLDRELNKHLAPLHGKHIPARGLREVKNDEQIDEMFSKAGTKLYKPTYGEVQTNISELRMSGFKEDPEYFGTEMDAEQVFAAERVANHSDLAERKYPVEIVAVKEDHWMSE